ncbi:hypothetical protein EV426DRAFT_572404 [Tirmania nivea]|nr:hypothetical protein EV426DRAFT_572404 [Tirmania nivea]
MEEDKADRSQEVQGIDHRRSFPVLPGVEHLPDPWSRPHPLAPAAESTDNPRRESLFPPLPPALLHPDHSSPSSLPTHPALYRLNRPIFCDETGNCPPNTLPDPDTTSGATCCNPAHKLLEGKLSFYERRNKVQLQRNQELQSQVDLFQSELSALEGECVEAIEELENKIKVLREEVEQQTSRADYFEKQNEALIKELKKKADHLWAHANESQEQNENDPEPSPQPMLWTLKDENRYVTQQDQRRSTDARDSPFSAEDGGAEFAVIENHEHKRRRLDEPADLGLVPDSSTRGHVDHKGKRDGPIDS